LEACKNDVIDVVDDMASRLYKAGKIKSRWLTHTIILPLSYK
jgi:hypothetical protein